MTHRPTVAVVVGRFQVPMLHKGHRHLIDTAMREQDELLMILGSAAFPTPRNPLSFEMRRAMIRTTYPGAAVLEIQDCRSNEDWTCALDKLIDVYYSGHDITLYGSRNSFLPHYTGRFKTVEVPGLEGFSGTAVRATCSHGPHTDDFRSGVIHGYTSRLAVTRPMVDIAVVKGENVLLGGKKSDPEDTWRFPGGLVDPTDSSFEAAAKRELLEEVSDIEIGDLTYVGSRQVNDWRYRGMGESGITTLFRTVHLSGIARAGDDLDRVAWIPLASLSNCLVEEHLALGEMLLKSLNA